MVMTYEDEEHDEAGYSPSTYWLLLVTQTHIFTESYLLVEYLVKQQMKHLKNILRNMEL